MRVTAARQNHERPAGGRDEPAIQAPLAREIREDIAHTIMGWALPTLALMICVFVFMLVRYAGSPPTRVAVLSAWIVVILISGGFFLKKQALQAAGILLSGLIFVTTTGTLLHGVDAPAFVAVMPVMALLVPLFGVRWAITLLVWHALVGTSAVVLAGGRLIDVAPLTGGVTLVAGLVFVGMTLAFSYVPTRLLVRSLQVAEARLRETELSREQERKSALALQEASEQLASARRLEALGKLSGGVAHDFNNMLGTVLAATELIALDRTGHEHPALDENLELIRLATERAADLTRKLLAFGRQDNFGVQSVDINQLVHETATLARATLGVRVKLELDCAPEELWVRGDRAALDHALLNLLLNARDALTGDGVIRIRTRPLSLEASWCAASGFAVEPGPAVQLSVEDNGCGMPAEVRERLFEPFFTTKPVGRGTGLGLSAVHGTIASQKGALQVESEPGRGSVFHVYLPLDSRPTAVASAPAPERDSASVTIGRGTVLVVDDDELHGRAVAGLVRQLGYDVQQFPSAQAALERLTRGGDVSAVVSDVVMPDTHGASFARTLAEQYPRLAVVLMTGFAPDGALDSLPARIPVLRKPFGRDELQASLTTALSAPTPAALAG